MPTQCGEWLVDVGSLLEPLPDGPGLHGSLRAGQVHQAEPGHRLTAHPGHQVRGGEGEEEGEDSVGPAGLAVHARGRHGPGLVAWGEAHNRFLVLFCAVHIPMCS